MCRLEHGGDARLAFGDARDDFLRKREDQGGQQELEELVAACFETTLCAVSFKYRKKWVQKSVRRSKGTIERERDSRERERDSRDSRFEREIRESSQGRLFRSVLPHSRLHDTLHSAHSSRVHS